MRISDWSSDVCSSDLERSGEPVDEPGVQYHPYQGGLPEDTGTGGQAEDADRDQPFAANGNGAVTETETEDEPTEKIGRASCRERVCQYVELSVGAVSIKKTKMHTDTKHKRKHR